jgi:hypothetical protein
MENEPFSMRSRNEGGHVPKGLGPLCRHTLRCDTQQSGPPRLGLASWRDRGS